MANTTLKGMLRTGFAAIALVATALVATPASAASVPAAKASMRVGGVTSQPIGHYEFCNRTPAECRQRSRRTRPVALNGNTWAAIVNINARVNGGVRAVTDQALHGVAELWSYPQGAGDCEDFALLKRNMLMQAGFKSSHLLITVVRQPNGEGHAVLTVRTDRGDFVLDNLDNRVRHWQDTPYQFLKRQAAFHSGRWVDITNGSAQFVGSVR